MSVFFSEGFQLPFSWLRAKPLGYANRCTTRCPALHGESQLTHLRAKSHQQHCLRCPSAVFSWKLWFVFFDFLSGFSKNAPFFVNCRNYLISVWTRLPAFRHGSAVRFARCKVDQEGLLYCWARRHGSRGLVSKKHVNGASWNLFPAEMHQEYLSSCLSSDGTVSARDFLTT